MTTTLLPIDDTKGSGFQFDAGLSENHKGEYTATEFPLEKTAVVADHIIKKPKQWTVTGKCTATPLDQVSYDATRLVTKLGEIQQLGDLQDLVTVVTDLDVFECSIQNYSVDKTVPDGNAFRVSISLKEMFIATTGTATIPKSVLKASMRKKTARAKKGGRTSGTTPKNGGTKKQKSWAAGLVDRLKR